MFKYWLPVKTTALEVEEYVGWLPVVDWVICLAFPDLSLHWLTVPPPCVSVVASAPSSHKEHPAMLVGKKVVVVVVVFGIETNFVLLDILSYRSFD
jgi:hypothetical protein